jgi:aspartyl-tRNA(Asn)/glutamyl-tRNA(Gln) amidotransferase subunit C
MAMRLREDTVTDGDMAERILANAPDRIGPYFGVPKVVE